MAQFQIVGEAEEPSSAPVSAGQNAALGMLMLSLKVLSQRTIHALADLFSLATVGSAWWLWWNTPDPNTFQLIELGIYAAFILVINWIVRKK